MVGIDETWVSQMLAGIAAIVGAVGGIVATPTMGVFVVDTEGRIVVIYHHLRCAKGFVALGPVAVEVRGRGGSEIRVVQKPK